MGDPSSAATSPPDPGRANAGQDFNSLARRIAGWTNNGLATALILVAGLTFGRQVLVWWRAEPAPPAARSAVPPELEDGLKQLHFGTLAGAIQTRTVRGSRDDVFAALRDLCRPSDRPGASAGSQATDAERTLLSTLAGKQPAESGDGWRIDQLPQGLPLVICSTTVERDSSRSRSTGERPGNGMNSVLRLPLDLRIISIGLAVPAADDQWWAYAFRLKGESRAASDSEPFPLPADSIRGLTLTQPDGTVLATFRGQATPAAWEEHFRTRPPEALWQLRRESVAKGPWHIEFDKPGAKPLRAEVHFEYDGQGVLHGLLLVAPADKP